MSELEQLTTRRAALARSLRELDTQIARLVTGHAPPYVVVRSDGAALTGRWSNRCRWSHDGPPYRFLYYGAAQRRAQSDGATVIPFETWAKTHPQHAVRSEGSER